MNFQMVMSCLHEIEKLAGEGSIETPKVKAPAPTAPRPSAPGPKPPSLKPVAPKPPAGAGRIATQGKAAPAVGGPVGSPRSPKTMLGGRGPGKQGQARSVARVAGGSVMRARAAPAAQKGIRAVASTPSPIRGTMPSRPMAPVGGANPVARPLATQGQVMGQNLRPGVRPLIPSRRF